MANQEPIIFYDIASGPPIRPFAPNPCKVRYALNFKGVNYKTELVELPDITSVRKRLGSAPVRFFPSGEPFYTLPVIKDPSTDSVVGDSFDIAVYLDKVYPNGPSLFPPSSIGPFAIFNKHVDSVFSTGHLLFSHGLPFNPKTAEQSKAEMSRRWGVKWENITVQGEERRKTLDAYKEALEEIAKPFRYSDGPFLGGKDATYADFIIGGWLKLLSVTMKDEWDEIKTWHDGTWGKLHQALEPYDS
ncbi:hypothetical protein F4804DRAFT_338344 [Jackrogersella minutella]|nr:hypothetical protein F4804DRAFT_338344 [Jackrogersella minutella]